MKAAGDSTRGREASTLALHFQFILPNATTSSTRVAVLLLERTLRALRPLSPKIGSLVLRMEKLFHTQDLGGRREADWRESMARSGQQGKLTGPAVSQIGTAPLDRIFVVTISGMLGSVLERLQTHLAQYRRYPFMFAVEVNTLDKLQQRLYLSSYATPIGVLHTDWTLEEAFGSIEYEPDLDKMLVRLEIDSYSSSAALSDALKVLDGR